MKNENVNPRIPIPYTYLGIIASMYTTESPNTFFIWMKCQEKATERFFIFIEWKCHCICVSRNGKQSTVIICMNSQSRGETGIVIFHEHISCDSLNASKNTNLTDWLWNDPTKSDWIDRQTTPTKKNLQRQSNGINGSIEVGQANSQIWNRNKLSIYTISTFSLRFRFLLSIKWKVSFSGANILAYFVLSTNLSNYSLITKP